MIDTTLSSFERDVIEASQDAPVLVDFWAPWCGPCASLGPILERLEREYAGRFRLVKVNADTNPELTASFSLQTIPHVVAFVDGNAVAQFTGAQPESFVRAFLDRIVPDPALLEHRAAREALALGKAAAAEQHLKSALALDPACDGARLDIMGLQLERGDLAAARPHRELLSPRAEQESAYAAVIARYDALEAAEKLPPVEVLRRRIEADPGDLQARLDLADLCVAQREFAEALDHLLEIVRRDRTFNEDVGRRKMLEVFQIAADQEALVADYRQRLGSLVF